MDNPTLWRNGRRESGDLVALGGDPLTSALFWRQVAKTPLALLESLIEVVLATAHRELAQE
ncbi:hypothetical protein ACT3SP_14130 [Brachybacterium sp. AOP43-C2-M15]|uniref:hypothetical protein n=1 Tax=Brachybacterium sp. AOP43-C2-M15 TaxID=3457661 RepID=UPI004034A50D